MLSRLAVGPIPPEEAREHRRALILAKLRGLAVWHGRSIEDGLWARPGWRGRALAEIEYGRLLGRAAARKPTGPGDPDRSALHLGRCRRAAG